MGGNLLKHLGGNVFENDGIIIRDTSSDNDDAHL